MGARCNIRINGEELQVDSQRSLMDVLRNDLHLKSVKDGCSEGACGTCTVLVDGKPQKLCVQKVESITGKHIQTVEGFDEKIKEAFVYAFGETGAVQCGFCIPGMVVCGKALLDANPNPSRMEIAAAMPSEEPISERNSLYTTTGSV